MVLTNDIKKTDFDRFPGELQRSLGKKRLTWPLMVKNLSWRLQETFSVEILSYRHIRTAPSSHNCRASKLKHAGEGNVMLCFLVEVSAQFHMLMCIQQKPTIETLGIRFSTVNGTGPAPITSLPFHSLAKKSSILSMGSIIQTRDKTLLSIKF